MQQILGKASGDDLPGAPWFQLLILIGWALAGSVLFNFLGIGVLALGYGSVEAVMDIIRNPYEDEGNRMVLFVLQGILSLGLFVIVPLFYARVNLNLYPGVFFRFSNQGLLYALVFVTLFCFMAVNAWIVEWNESWVLPQGLKSIEQALQGKEQELARLTEFLLGFDSTWQFFVALIVIAVLPGVGEELVFRGLIQNLFFKGFKNAHVAIWVAAFLFSAIHLQFYGLIPRMLLGAFFGYIYFWTGRLSLAMFAHFLNNAISLLLVFFYNRGQLSFDPDGAEAVPDWPYLLIFGMIGTFTLLTFRNNATRYYGHMADRL